MATKVEEDETFIKIEQMQKVLKNLQDKAIVYDYFITNANEIVIPEQSTQNLGESWCVEAGQTIDLSA